MGGRDERELDGEIERDSGVTVESTEDRPSGDRVRARLRQGGTVLSPRALALALVFVTAGVVVFDGVVPVAGPLVGVLAAAFVYGTVSGGRRYVELATAGAVVGGGAALLGHVAVTLLGPGLALTALGTGGGAVAALFGHYLGRDLRDGLTREI